MERNMQNCLERGFLLKCTCKGCLAILICDIWESRRWSHTRLNEEICVIKTMTRLLLVRKAYYNFWPETHIWKVYGGWAIFLAPWVTGLDNAVIEIKKPAITSGSLSEYLKNWNFFKKLTEVSCILLYSKKGLQGQIKSVRLAEWCCYLFARMLSWSTLSNWGGNF